MVVRIQNTMIRFHSECMLSINHSEPDEGCQQTVNFSEVECLPTTENIWNQEDFYSHWQYSKSKNETFHSKVTDTFVLHQIPLTSIPIHLKRFQFHTLVIRRQLPLIYPQYQILNVHFRNKVCWWPYDTKIMISHFINILKLNLIVQFPSCLSF